MILMQNKYLIKKNKKFGFYQISPTPSKEEVDKYYEEEFYSTKKKSYSEFFIEQE